MAQGVQIENVDPSTEVAEGSLKSTLIVWLLTSFADFGGLVVLDLLLHPDSGTPRMYSFLATTVGISIFLPTATAGWYLLRAQLPPSRSGRAAGLVVGTLAGTAMLFGKLIWLVDTNPQSTWKLEGAHRLSTMGWYNLVFSIVIFAVGGYLVGDAQGRLHSARWNGGDLRRGAKTRSRATWLALIGLVGYSITVVADNVEFAERASSQAAIFLIILLLSVGALIVWLLRIDYHPLYMEYPAPVAADPELQ